MSLKWLSTSNIIHIMHWYIHNIPNPTVLSDSHPSLNTNSTHHESDTSMYSWPYTKLKTRTMLRLHIVISPASTDGHHWMGNTGWGGGNTCARERGGESHPEHEPIHSHHESVCTWSSWCCHSCWWSLMIQYQLHPSCTWLHQHLLNCMPSWRLRISAETRLGKYTQTVAVGWDKRESLRERAWVEMVSTSPWFQSMCTQTSAANLYNHHPQCIPDSMSTPQSFDAAPWFMWSPSLYEDDWVFNVELEVSHPFDA